MTDRRAPDHPWRQERDDLLHGVAGAFLFGAPLLYTMEVWWTGSFTSPLRMLVALAGTYLALIVLDAATGFRQQRATRLGRRLTDSAEALALGLVLATASLLLLRRIGPEVGPEALLGRIILEAVPFSLGVGIANGLLHVEAAPADAARASADGDPDVPTAAPAGTWRATLAQAGATVLGATIVAFSIAPTDEVPMIAAALHGPWLLALVLASLLLSYLIVFAAHFGVQARRQARPGVIRSPVSETVLAYGLSLLLAALTLWLFQLLRPEDPPRQWVAYILVLGLPASIGGAAGRLAV
jgi:putative integral membrane protein (TIGR02587 family)